MTGKARIFISSTCYDLEEIRDSIQHDLEEVGHEVMISDSSQFPVGFNHDPIETCIHNIKNNTEIFVLIIGSRAGWTHERFDRTVVNLEYDAAKNAGLDILVFARKPLLDLLPNWKANHEYAEDVDSPLVYKLLNNVQIDGYWIEPFERRSNIIHILKEQLSSHLKRLVTERKAGKFTPLPEFEHESLRAQQIVMERPKYWEFLLQEELLRTKIRSVRAKYNDLERGLSFNKSKRMTAREFLDWINVSMADFKNIITSFGLLCNEEFFRSVGPPGVAGDPHEILSTIEKIVDCAKELLNWEKELKFFILPDECNNLQSILQWGTKPTIATMESIAEEISEIFRLPEPEGMHTIALKLTLGWDQDIVTQEMGRLIALLNAGVLN